MLKFLKFNMVGVANTIVGYGLLFILLTFTALNPLVSNVLSYLLTSALAFYLQKRFVFSNKDTRIVQQYLRFMITFLSCYGVSFVVLYLIVRYLDLGLYLPHIISGVVYVGLNFLAQGRITFREIGHARRDATL